MTPHERREEAARRLAEVLDSLQFGSRASRDLGDGLAAAIHPESSSTAED
jgi:hypothetical protein